MCNMSVMPSLTPAQLQEARIRSGRLGGRPKKPSVEEARRASLDELVPKALRVLNEHLDSGRADAWRSAWRVVEYAYGKAPEALEELFVMPQTIEEVEKLSWSQLVLLAGEPAEELRDGRSSPSS